MADNRPIGIYDSGLGGLTVWREVRRALPGESLAYLGDGANCPYGSRPREEVQALADAAVARLVELCGGVLALYAALPLLEAVLELIETVGGG